MVRVSFNGEPTASSNAYDDFAWLYSQDWGADFHRQALPALESFCLARLPPRARVLDLCCGTGDLSALLVSRGFEVTGLDSSEPMLEYARSKAPQAAFVRADARQFAFPPVFHAALSTFDSLNHILELRELIRVFENVYGALRPGGLLVFDLNMEPSFRTLWRGVSAKVSEHCVWVLRGGYDAEHRIGRAEITVFRRCETWRRSDITIEEKCYSEQEVMGALHRAGFRDAECREAWELGMLGEAGEGRSFFRARK